MSAQRKTGSQQQLEQMVKSYAEDITGVIEAKNMEAFMEGDIPFAGIRI